MSIRVEIANRIGERPQRLFFLPPLIGSTPVVRELFVSEEINAVVHPPFSNSEIGRRLSQMRAYLDTQWTAGLRVTVADHPYKKPKATFMARVDPVGDEVFDIRCIDPKPGIRVLGCFGGRNLFVALTFNFHENLQDSRDWRNEIERCKTLWRSLFHTYPPHSGPNLNDYLTNFQPV